MGKYINTHTHTVYRVWTLVCFCFTLLLHDQDVRVLFKNSSISFTNPGFYEEKKNKDIMSHFLICITTEAP